MLSHLLLQLSVMFLAVTGGLHVRCCATCCSTDETLFQAVFSIHMQGLMGIQRVVVNPLAVFRKNYPFRFTLWP